MSSYDPCSIRRTLQGGTTPGCVTPLFHVTIQKEKQWKTPALCSSSDNGPIIPVGVCMKEEFGHMVSHSYSILKKEKEKGKVGGAKAVVLLTAEQVRHSFLSFWSFFDFK